MNLELDNVRYKITILFKSFTRFAGQGGRGWQKVLKRLFQKLLEKILIFFRSKQQPSSRKRLYYHFQLINANLYV